MYKQSLKALVQGYAQLCNQALSLNRNRFPFKQILGAVLASDRRVDVEWCVEVDGEEEAFIVHLTDGRLVVDDCAGEHGCDCNGQWHVSATYLRDVLEDSESYIRNPAKMNWEWAYGRAAAPWDVSVAG